MASQTGAGTGASGSGRSGTALFDDIPYLKTAEKSSMICLRRLCKGQGVEVVYLEDLTAEVLKNPEKKEQFVREFIAEGGASATKVREQLYEYLMNIADEKELVLKTMSGIRASELNVKMSCPLVSLVKKESQFLLDPIPNLYFTRDPFACIGNGVSLNHMYSRTRRRETLYGKYILNIIRILPEKYRFTMTERWILPLKAEIF